MKINTEKVLVSRAAYFVFGMCFLMIISGNFFKPFGFFRESNPALVCINADYWNVHPKTRSQHIPVFSYAYDETKPAKDQFYSTVTTFGFAWYTAPYYFFKLSGWAPGPVSIRTFSLVWLAFTLYMLMLVGREMLYHEKSKLGLTIFLIFYLFSPGNMWYMVNGYVHETAVLPFYYAGWYFFQKYIRTNHSLNLWLVALALMIGVQFDWLPCFQAAVISAYLLFTAKKQSHKLAFAIPAVGILIGVSYIFYNYFVWASVEPYLNFLQEKFLNRTVGAEGTRYIGFLPSELNLALFYILSFGILLLLSILYLLRFKKLHLLVLLMVITACLHHVAFWGFSTEHDYSTIKMGAPIALCSALWVMHQKKRILAFVVSAILFGIFQYALLHYIYKNELKADYFQVTGEIIRNHPESEAYINTDGNYYTQIEFYAKRPYNRVKDKSEAISDMYKREKSKGIFITTPGFQIDSLNLQK